MKMICIMGPTASGKSELALRTAEELGGEIVSADSMQLYSGIPIGTAQPSAEELARVPHHLVGCFDFSEKIDVYRYVELADNAIADIAGRGKIPVVAGGTGFYLKSLLYGLDQLPGDDSLRAELDAKFDSDEAFDALREEMARLDPAGLERWCDCRRKLIRALEVRMLTGKSILDLQSGPRPLRYQVDAQVLDRPPELLRKRIAERCDRMLAAGWIEEGRTAIAQGILKSPTAHQALGYKLIDRFLRNELSFEELRFKLIAQTGQYARRQRTWFRHQHPEARVIAMP
ncbi:MAG: tRNA (adenosine(37)-N6)-dimethylallyltransferase MiaA [Victivallaceae bacterium]